jgi:hypothetical protein
MPAPHGTLAAYVRHRRAGEQPCADCVDGARAQWRVKARRRFEAAPDRVREINRNHRAKAVRCRICGRVVTPDEVVHVQPLRSPNGRPSLPCHGACAHAQGRVVVDDAVAHPFVDSVDDASAPAPSGPPSPA